jgi:prepilin-type N-terminal cleavage/methylation domain-containing protein
MSLLSQSKRRSQRGFTFLELLITTTLGLIVLGGALASYRTFGIRQARSESAKAVIGLLHRAQRRARSGDKPVDDCNSLNGYRVWAVPSTQQYTLSVRCDGDNDDREAQSFSLKDQEYFQAGFDVTFSPNSGPILSSPTTVEIGPLGGGDNHYEFIIEQNGIITDTGIVDD